MQEKQNLSAVILHGGAGTISERHGERKIPVLDTALHKACEIVQTGGEALAAVTEALTIMEESEYFNAGFGGYPDENLEVKLDAALMTGNGDFLGLLGVSSVKKPSQLVAKLFQPGQQLLKRVEAKDIADLKNLSPEEKKQLGFCKPSELISPYVESLFKLNKLELETTKPELEKGTVGCLVRDCSGNLAAGTSTGGIYLKPQGRVADSPLIGQGVFASNSIGALSASGYGEKFMQTQASAFALARVREKLRISPQYFERNPAELEEILKQELKEMTSLSGEGGGLIFLPPRGNPEFAFTSKAFAVAMAYYDKDQGFVREVTVSRLSA